MSKSHSELGRLDWAKFSTVRLLFEGSLGFFKQRNGPKIGDTFGYSLLHFQINKLYKTWFVFWHYLAWQLFWLLFKKYWAIFFQIIWSPCTES
jgi:hypothetical protein